MFIQTESTPNPATLKFLPGQSVMDMGTADFPSADGASASPLAERIFAVEGTAGVFLGSDFVTVTKTDTVDWDHIKPALLGAIMEHFQSGHLYCLMAKLLLLRKVITMRLTNLSLSKLKNFWILAFAPLWRKMVVI